jgi:SAM-dependent methyltransferase
MHADSKRRLAETAGLHMKDSKTIADFDDQWSRFTGNSGFYASKELFEDIVSPFVRPEDLRNKTVVEIGSGTGRIVNMLLACGAGKVYAVEPGPRAFEALKRNTQAESTRIVYLNVVGEDLPKELQADYVFSIGVIHHIPRPEATLRACLDALRPGGKCLIWLYGKEGNGLFLAFLTPLRWMTVRLPHPALTALSHFLNGLLDVYIALCRWLPLPLRDYALNVIGRMSRDKRHLVIYDQLNPAHAKYYTRDEAERLLRDAGFAEVRLHHRRGYSWTVIGARPA